MGVNSFSYLTLGLQGKKLNPVVGDFTSLWFFR